MSFLQAILGSFKGTSEAVRTIKLKPYLYTFSPDGGVLAAHTIQPNNAIILIDTRTGGTLEMLDNVPEISERAHPYDVTLQFSPDGQFLISSGQVDKSDGRKGAVIRIWDTKTRRPVHDFKYRKIDCAPAFSPDSKSLAVGLSEQFQSPSIDVMRLDGTKLASTSVNEPPQMICFSPDKIKLFSVRCNYLSRWRIEGQALNRAGEQFVNSNLHEVVVSGDGTTLITSGGSTIYVWDADSLRSRCEFGEFYSVHSTHLSADGKILIATVWGGSSPKDLDGTTTIYFYDLDTKQLRHKTEGIAGSTRSALSRDGRMIASIGRKPRSLSQQKRGDAGWEASIQLRRTPEFVK